MKRSHDIGYGFAALFAVLYLLNIGMGVFELIPDNLPFIGNIDEAGAALLLWKALQYFFIRRRKT